MKKREKRIISILLSLVLVLSLMPAMSLMVVADDPEKYGEGITGLGTGAISNPLEPDDKDTPWNGSYVYYGKYDGTPTKYRVLDKASTDFGVEGGSLLLDCDNILVKMKHDSNTPCAYGKNGWTNSEIKAWLNGTEEGAFYHDSFTAQEKETIIASTKSVESPNDGVGREEFDFQPLTGEKVFLLDAKEATRPSYGYKNDFQVSNTRTKTGASTWWWLRSPDNEENEQDRAGSSYPQGVIYSHPVDAPNGAVSPAFNIKLSSVIFSSLVSGTSGQVEAEYKLTLKDPKLTIAAGAVDEGNNKYHIPYTITDNSDAEPTQLSVVVTNGTWDNGWSENAQLLQYSKLDVDSLGTSGTGTFTLNNNITGTWGTDYHVYVLVEDVNDKKETDYASTPVELTLSEPAATVPIYRLYDPNSGAHLFISNAAEKDNLVLIGWEYEGVAWTAPASSNIPVYRVYNPNSGEHHYTTNASEKDILVALGWKDEGIGWYSDENRGTPLYRLYNPNATGQYAAGAHHYTKDVKERDYLITAGWNDEGIGWYGK